MQPAINILIEELEEAAAYCRAEGCGAEITAFAYPAVLDSDSCAASIEQHREALRGLPQLSLHGPFLDLYVTSGDPRIVEVCRARHEQALRAALSLSVQVYVAHLNSLPLIRNRGYVAAFAERAAAFWRPLAELAWEGGVTIALENMWERTPEVQKRVVEEVSHPGLKASFDSGHALVFSDVPATTWVKTLGSDLAHCHLHDNDGEYDSHLPIGDGIEDWAALLAALNGMRSRPMLVLESDKLDRNQASLRSWRHLTGEPASSA